MAKQTKWSEHVKEVSKKNKGKSLKEILVIAKSSYKKEGSKK